MAFMNEIKIIIPKMNSETICTKDDRNEWKYQREIAPLGQPL